MLIKLYSLFYRTDWASAKLVLGDTYFLKKLQEYDKDHISDIVLRKLKPYIEHPDFTPEKIATVSKACKSMCMWVRAVDMYAKVYRIVEPKRKKYETYSIFTNLNKLHSLFSGYKQRKKS